MRALIVGIALAGSSVARADEPALAVSSPSPVDGDGRGVVPVVVAGRLAVAAKELPVPEVAVVACTGAASLAAVEHQQPAVLAPVVTTATTLSCVAHLRDLAAPFALAVRPPPPGLYARAAEAEVRTTVTHVDLDAFAWDGHARGVPVALRAAASDARVDVIGDRLGLELTGKAPRLIALALADGERVGAAFVPVIGVATLPVESELGATVQVWIAGRWFGPVATVGRLAKVAIEVPPGVTTGVARSIGRSGYVTDAVTDLKVPPRARIAAVAGVQDPAVGEPSTIAIAIAGADGRPASPSLQVVARAERGQLGALEAQGGGLWRVRYIAPGSPGADHVAIHVEGDPTAGTATLAFDVAPGRPSRIEIAVPTGAVAPGSELVGTARVFDAAGNPLPDAEVSARLAGVPLAVSHDTPSSFHGVVPERLPDDHGELSLEVASGTARARLAVHVRTTAVTARVESTLDGRRAIVDLVVGDRFANLVEIDDFQVEIRGGTRGPIARHARGFRTSVVADPGAAEAQLIVRSGTRVLAETVLGFELPARAFGLGAWVNGAWLDNLGGLATVRAGGGLALRRNLAGIEVALVAGIEGLRFHDSPSVVRVGASVETSRTVVGIGIPMSVRVRLPLSRRFGVALGAGLVPMRMGVTLSIPDQAVDRHAETVLGARLQVGGDAVLGPGRLLLGVDYGRAALSSSVVVGQVDGLAVRAGYEWWFADFGR